jgi:SAM-dependent methyltransferase
MSRLDSRILEANSSVYGDPETVDSYLTRPYHQLRISLCCSLLDESLRRSFPCQPRSEIKILDLGSSTGRLALTLAGYGYGVVASDIELSPLKRAHLNGLPCVQLDAASPLPFAHACFSGVVMAELIEHLFDTKAVLAECNRVLRPGGILAITTPNLATAQDRLRFLFGLSPRQVNPLHSYLKFHIRPFTYRLLREILQAEGFQSCKVRSNYVVVRFPYDWVLQSRFLARIFPTLGGSLIVLARKA